MAEEEFFFKYLFQLVKKFCRKYILKETGVLNDTQNTAK